MSKKHVYTGYISFGYEVVSDEPLDSIEIIDAIEAQITTHGIPDCDLGDVEHYIDDVVQED